MKKLIFLGSMTCLLSACTTAFNLDIRPDATASKVPSAVVWSNANDTSLAAATSDLVLSDIPRSESSALALLGQLKGAYATDPYVMTQVGAVSQWTMRPGRERERTIWIGALLKTAETTQDAYVQMTCLDQLRWCGDAGSVSRIRAIGAKGDKSVGDFSEMVIRELSGRSIGL